MTSSRITIEDVASAAQVSRQTVSRVINRSPRVASASRERVEAAIAALGYVPNAAARRMGGARSFTLLAVIERGAGTSGAGQRTGRLPLDAMLLAGLDRCGAAGYHLLFEQLDNGGQDGLAQLNRAISALSPDGVILTPPLDERTDLRDAVEGRGVALDVLGERIEFGRASPGIDDGALGEAAAQKLLELGHRQIGFLTGAVDPMRSQRRLAGYRRAMATRRCRAHQHFAASGQLRFDAAAKLARSWLTPTIRPTALIAETEEVALAILGVARELGLEVPRVLSLISLEERASLARAEPPICSVFQPYAALFAAACDRLIARQQAKDITPGKEGETMTAEHAPALEWIERQSLAKAPRAI